METSQQRAIFVKVSDFLFLTEPVWVGAAVSLVYFSIIFHLASFLPWLMLAIAFAPFPLRPLRNEAAPHQPMAQQIGNPLGILHVRLASGHCLNVLDIQHC